MVQVIYMNGGAQSTTNLIALPATIGQSLIIFTNWQVRKKGKIRWKSLCFITATEGIAQIFLLNGMMLAGASIFTVIYSSITIYTAIFSYLVLGRRLAVGQWMGIFITVFGLGLASEGAGKEGSTIVAGVCLISIGSIMHSLIYVLTEYLMGHVEDPCEPEMLGSMLGLIAVGMNMSWQIVYTIPRWDTLVLQNIETHNGDIRIVLLCYLGIVLSSLGHSFCFFRLLKSAGSTTTGMMKCVQAVGLFLASHFAFCGINPHECFTMDKAGSLVIVLTGVMLYSIYAYNNHYNPDAEEERSVKELPHIIEDVELSSYQSDQRTYSKVPQTGDEEGFVAGHVMHLILGKVELGSSSKSTMPGLFPKIYEEEADTGSYYQANNR